MGTDMMSDDQKRLIAQGAAAAQQQQQQQAADVDKLYQTGRYGGYTGGAKDAASGAGRIGFNQQQRVEDAGYAQNQSLQNQGQNAQNIMGGVAGTQFSQAGQAQGRAGQMYGAQQGSAAQGGQDLQQLRQWAQQGPGPSVAAAQYGQASDQAMAQQMAMARSGRGAGQNASAMRDAQFTNAATQQQMAGQAATARMQENQQYKQNQLGAMGAIQQGDQAQRGQDIQAMQAQGALGAQYAGLGTQAMGQGQQLGQGYNIAGGQQQFGYNQLGQQSGQYGQTLANDIQTGEANRGVQQFEGYANRAAGSAASAAAQPSSSTTKDIMAGVGTAVGVGAMMFSDSEAKKDKAKSDGALEALHAMAGTDYAAGAAGQQQFRSDVDQGAGGAWAMPAVQPAPAAKPTYGQIMQGGQMGGQLGGALGGIMSSDDRAKTDLRPAEGYSYRYKDPGAPGAAPGRHFGPMAQDLEKTPAGRSTVVDTPQGKMVDTGRLTMVTAAATSETQRRLDDAESEIDRLRKLVKGGK